MSFILCTLGHDQLMFGDSKVLELKELQFENL